MPKESAEINPAGIQLIKESGVPLYVQVYKAFRKMIITKRLRPGDRLPASRNLSAELGVSRVIISQAFEQLIMEGYLVGKTGSGTFVADVLPDELLHVTRAASSKQQAKPTRDDKPAQTIQDDNIIPFMIGTPSLDSFPYKAWYNTANKVLKNLKKYHLGYDDTLGYWPLRKAIASYLRISRAVNCEAEQVVVVTGSQQGLNLVTTCLLKKNDKVWIEDPGYFGAKDAFTNADVNICPVPVEEDGLNIDYAIKKFPAAKLAYVTPSHQFPLGCTLSQSKRLQLLEYAQQNKLWIFEDDYDSEFRYEGSPLPSLQGLDNHGRVIYSGTFSKVLFPALRLAYLVLPSIEMVNQFRVVKEHTDRQSPVMEQAILCRFMEDGYFLRHIRKMRLLYAERQQVLIQLINDHASEYLQPIIAPSGMHLLCRLNDNIDVTKLRQEIKKKKIAVSFTSDFAINSIGTAMLLGYTAFSKYKLKTGLEHLINAIKASLKEPC